MSEAQTETCPYCRQQVELSADRGRRGMLKAHTVKPDQQGITCKGSWAPGLETYERLI